MRYKLAGTDSQKLDQKVSLWVGILSLLYISFIILAGVYSNDDIGRSILGYFRWVGNGRPLASLVFELLNIDWNYLTNLAPLTHLLAALITSYGALLISENLFADYNRFARTLLSLTLLINPFYLENLTFNFDSLSMACSVFACSVAVVLTFEGGKKNLLWALALLIAACCFYQFALNLYPCLMLIISYERLLKRQFSLKILGQGLGLYLLANALYMPLIRFFLDDYVAQVSELVSINGQIFSHVEQSFLIALSKIGMLFHGNYGIIFALLAALIIFHLGKTLKSSRKGEIFFIVALPVLLIIFMVGPFVLTKESAWPPRFFISYGALMLFMFFVFFDTFKSRLRYMIIYPLILSFSLCASYSNILKRQEEFTRFLAERIINDLESNGYNQNSSLSFVNEQPFSPELANGVRAFPFFLLLVPRYLKDSRWHAEIYYYRYRLPTGTPKNEWNEEIHPLVKTGPYYRLYSDKKDYYVEFL